MSTKLSTSGRAWVAALIAACGCSFEDRLIRQVDDAAFEDRPVAPMDVTPVTDVLPPADVVAVVDRPDAPPLCYTQEGTAPLCPVVTVAQADPMRPSFRVTHLRMAAPVAFSSAILSGTFNGAIHAGGFLLGLTFDLSTNVVRAGALNPQTSARGSVGQGLFDGTFRHYSRNAPAVGGATARWDPVYSSVAASGDRASTGVFTETLRLPIFDTSGTIITELPLDIARFSTVQLTPDRRCIGLGAPSGGRFNECTSGWQTADGATTPYGRIQAIITVAAARQVQVVPLMTTLCDLLSGSNCETMPQTVWARQPDAMAGGQPGYSFSAEFAAVSARVE